MCTLSWRVDANGYQVFFNRDEQRTRAKALPPKCLLHDGVKVIMPTDPEASGSWISVNESGLSLCLLNFYQGSLPQGKLTSRGKLITLLSSSCDSNSLYLKLAAINLNNFAPFSLVCFSREQTLNNTIQISAFQWDGGKLEKVFPQQPFLSSSVKFEEVGSYRKKIYSKHVKTGNPEEFLQFHKAHSENKDYRSVCMHREDAKTVSFSHIFVDQNRIEFNYTDDSPCKEDFNIYRMSI